MWYWKGVFASLWSFECERHPRTGDDTTDAFREDKVGSAGLVSVYVVLDALSALDCGSGRVANTDLPTHPVGFCVSITTIISIDATLCNHSCATRARTLTLAYN